MFSKLCKIVAYSDVDVRGELDELRVKCGLLPRADSLVKRQFYHELWQRMHREKAAGLAILISKFTIT